MLYRRMDKMEENQDEKNQQTKLICMCLAEGIVSPADGPVEQF